MPRLLHQPPKYRLHKGSGQAIASLLGRRVYLGTHGSEDSLRKYQTLVEEWRRSTATTGPAGSFPDPPGSDRLAAAVTPLELRAKRRQGGRVTLDELILVYRRHAHAYYVKKGRVTREAGMVVEVTSLLGPKHGDMGLEDFGPVELDNFRDDLIADRDWSRKVINKQVGRVVRMFKWAVSKELCTAEVYARLAALGGLKKGRTNARETEGVHPVDDKVVELTLPHLPEIVADMVRLQRLCGARPGEVCSLRPCDLDRSGEVWVYVPDEHKTEHHDRRREVYIGPLAQAVLRPYLLRAATAFCFSPAETVARARASQRRHRSTAGAGAELKERPARTTAKWRPSNRYQVASYRMAVRRGCVKAGVEVWSPNRLRHTAATEVRRMFGLEAAQVVCGHSRADVTQVYAERDRDLARRVARALG